MNSSERPIHTEILRDDFIYEFESCTRKTILNEASSGIIVHNYDKYSVNIIMFLYKTVYAETNMSTIFFFFCNF